MKKWPLRKAYVWETAPFFRLLLPFIVGIICYDAAWLTQLNLVETLTTFILFTVVIAILILTYKKLKINSIFTFLIFNVLLATVGFAVSYLNDIKNNKNWYGNNKGDALLVRIAENPVEKEKTWKISFSAISVFQKGKILPALGDGLVYLKKDRNIFSFSQGDTILIPNQFVSIKNSGNPNEFDYATFCRRKNLYLQQFAATREIKLVGKGNPNDLPVLVKTHRWCMNQLDKYLPDKTVKGLLQAMLLGDEINLDEQMRQMWTDTGIVHIIAISGGNVMFLFWVLSLLFLWQKNKKHRWVKYLLAVPIIWFYVLMAGGSVSAIRAAMMFTLLAISILIEKNNNPLNQLLATTFVLLFACPAWLFSVGFQLSFIAVLSLILFYGKIYGILQSKNVFLQKIWGAVAASLAAEILVAPLIIYYFHNFPLVFLVANVIAFIFMEAVLFLGIALVLFSWLVVLPNVLGWVITFLVSSFNKIVFVLQGFNPAALHFLKLEWWELVLVYCVITFLAVFIYRKKKLPLFLSLIFICFLLFSFCINEWQHLHQKYFVIFDTNTGIHAEMVWGKSNSVLHTDTLQKKKIDYAVKPFHIERQAYQGVNVTESEFFTLGNMTILFLNKELPQTDGFHVDYLVLDNIRKPDFLRMQKIFTPTTIIINKFPKRKRRKNAKDNVVDECTEIYNVREKGAFVRVF